MIDQAKVSSKIALHAALATAAMVALTITLLLCPRMASADPATAVPIEVGMTGAGPVYLQPLDVPGNPYAGQYSDYDRWVYEHARIVPTEEIQKYYDYESAEAEAWRTTKPANWQLEQG